MLKENQIILQSISENGRKQFWGFSTDACGVLSYKGELSSVEDSDFENKMMIVGSPYFTPSWYGYLPIELDASFEIYLPEGENYSADLIGFLTHVGPMLLAVKFKDYLLAVQLLSRRFKTFKNYSAITQYILKDAAFPAFLTWNYGRFESYSESGNVTLFLIEILGHDFEKIVKKNECQLELAVEDKLKKEGTILSFPLVGVDFQDFDSAYENLVETYEREQAKNLVRGKEPVKNIHRLFDDLTVCVQAEPYNSHDSKAIGVYIQNPNVSNKHEKLKAGYMRATLAEILRNAFPKKLSYKGKLIRIGGMGYNAKKSIILQIEVPKLSD